MNHAVQGVVSFNDIMSADILKSRLIDCIPNELQDKVEKQDKDQSQQQPRRLRGVNKLLHIKLNQQQMEANKMYSHFEFIKENLSELKNNQFALNSEMKYLAKLLTALTKNKTELTLKFVKDCMQLVEKLRFDEGLKKKLTEVLLVIYKQSKERQSSNQILTPSGLQRDEGNQIVSPTALTPVADQDAQNNNSA